MLNTLLFQILREGQWSETEVTFNTVQVGNILK